MSKYKVGDHVVFITNSFLLAYHSHPEQLYRRGVITYISEPLNNNLYVYMIDIEDNQFLVREVSCMESNIISYDRDKQIDKILNI